MRHLDLFAGIGSFSLAASWLGWETVGMCEIDPFCRRVLKKNFPGVPIVRDVQYLADHADALRGDIDILTGGFPCQDISIAGRGAGLDGERSGLWFDMLRVIRAARPRWVVAENVPALYHRGIDTVLGGLEEAGYSCWPLVVGASDVGAPHRRKRVWIVGRLAHAVSSRDGQPSRHAFHEERRTRAAGGASLQGGRIAPERHTQPAGEDGDLGNTASGPVGRLAWSGMGTGEQAERQRQANHDLADRPGEDCCNVADTEGAGPSSEPFAGLRGRLQDGLGEPGTAMADADGSGRGEQRRAVTVAQELAAAERNGCMADTEDTDWRRAGGTDDRGRRASEVGGPGTRRAGTVESCVGRGFDGPAPGLDFTRWPARPGEPQHEWEPPRTVKGQKDRAARLRALGNSIVPQAAYVILRAIAETDAG